MTDLDILRIGFVAFVDGLWWGLRENTGPLSMYEGYSGGFKQMGEEIAEANGGKGPDAAAEIAGEIFRAIGMDVEVDKREIIVKSCPIWNRILERGLEFSFHIEKICWMPMLEGIGEKTGAKPEMESALRLAHIESTKVDYRKSKVKAALDKNQITKEEYDKEMVILDQRLVNTPTFGLYRFK